MKTCDELVISPQDPNLWIQALQLIGNIEGKKVREEHIEEILQVNFFWTNQKPQIHEAN